MRPDREVPAVMDRIDALRVLEELFAEKQEDPAA